MMSAAIIYTLTVAPIFQNQAWAQGSNEFGLNQQGIKDSAEEQEKKPKRKMLETLVMMSFALTALISPIAQRTARAKNDCDSNFSGPVSLFIVKLAGLMHVINEIRQFDIYSKKSQSVRDIQTGVAMDKIEGKEGDTKENKLMNYDDLFAKLINLYEGQQDALISKNKSLDRVDGSLKTALALETYVGGACTGVCIGHQAARKAEKRILISALKAYMGKLQTFVTAFSLAICTAAPATNAALAALQGTVASYISKIELALGKNSSKAVAKSAKQIAKSGKDWSLLSKEFAALSDPALAEILGNAEKIFTEAVADLEKKIEEAESKTNEAEAKAFLTSSSTMAATLAAQMVTFKAAAAIDHAVATGTSGVATLGACAVSAAGAQAALQASIVGIESAHRSLPIGFVAVDKVVYGFEQVMGKGIGATVDKISGVLNKALDKLTSILNKSASGVPDVSGQGMTDIGSNVNMNETPVDMNQVKGNMNLEGVSPEAAAAANKVMEGATGQTVSTVFPIVAGIEKMLNKRMTCCGSDGRLGGEPNMRMAIPKTPGILYKKPDLIPPKALLALDNSARKMLDQNHIEKMVSDGRGEELYTEVMTMTMRTLAAEMIYNEYLDRMKGGERISQHDYTLMLARIEGALETGENEFTADKLSPQEKSFIELALKKIGSEFGISSAFAEDTRSTGGKLGAMWDNIGGFMGLGAVFLAVKYRKKVMKIYGFATKAPIYRVGFYTVLKFLTNWNISNNEKSIEDVQKQIDFLNSQKELLKEKYTGGEDLLAISQGHMPGDSNFSFPKAKKSGDSKNCMNFGSGGVSRTACPARNSKGSFSFPNRKELANFQGFSTALDNISALGEALSNSEANSAHVDVLSGKLNAAAKRLEADTKGTQEELNSLFAEKDAKGKPQSPLERMVGQMLGGFGGGGGAGGGLGGGAGMGMSASLSPNLSGENEKSSSEYNPSPVTDMGALEFGEGGMGSMDEFGMEADSEGIADSVAGKEEQNLDDFELADHDINVDTSASIFEVLSKRYLLSYPKVLEMKDQPKAEVPDKAKE
jgi:hypothetical protein